MKRRFIMRISSKFSIFNSLLGMVVLRVFCGNGS